ncbi:MAG: group II truncated hemoglobin [Nitrosospira sp.]|nr:group II truncated hemoglobin [Nitrosospira sp.]
MHLSEAYKIIGGEISIRKLVDNFYDLMSENPDYFAIRKLHPQNLKDSRDKLFMFLSGWMGGPSLYVKKYGEPRLRSRHLVFSIGILEKDQWLSCMNQAMINTGVQEGLRKNLFKAFEQTADFMRNRSE